VEQKEVANNVISGLRQRLRSKDFGRFGKFAIVGGSGVVVNMAGLWLGKNFIFTAMPLAQAVAWAGALAIAVSIITNFALNDLWTWGDREKLGFFHFIRRFSKYVMVASFSGIVQWLILQGLVHLGFYYLLANFVGIGVGVVINYCANNWWTFRAISHEEDFATTSSPAETAQADRLT